MDHYFSLALSTYGSDGKDVKSGLQEKIINQFLCIMFEQYPNLLVFNLAFVFSCFCLYFSLEIIDFSLASP